MMKSVFKLIMVAAILAVTGIAVSGGAIAANSNSNQQGSSNGQPFVDLNELFQAEIDAVEAALQNEADCINDYLTGTSNAAGPCLDYSNSIIEDLETDLAMLQSDFDDLEDIVDNAQCPAGWSIRDLDPLTCEFDSTINDRLVRTVRYGNSVSVAYLRFGTSTATCPSSMLPTGCGIDWQSGRPVMGVTDLIPWGNGCRAVAYHSNFSFRGDRPRIRAVATCAQASPAP